MLSRPRIRYLNKMRITLQCNHINFGFAEKRKKEKDETGEQQTHVKLIKNHK